VTSAFDACARCRHARANHARTDALPAGGPGACLFSSCDCQAFVEPVGLAQLRELRRRLASEVLEARRRAAGLYDEGHVRAAAEHHGRGDGLDRAIALLDELVPVAKP
jgi:hypothetical protein